MRRLLTNMRRRPTAPRFSRYCHLGKIEDIVVMTDQHRVVVSPDADSQRCFVLYYIPSVRSTSNTGLHGAIKSNIGDSNALCVVNKSTRC